MKQLFSENIIISAAPLDLLALNQQVLSNQGENGAVVTFTGSVRGGNKAHCDSESELSGMSLEHYPGMTEKQLAMIIQQASQRWQLNNVLVVHRVGFLTPGEPIVFVATVSLHRKEAFQAAEFIMDYLKQNATFWKKEHYADKQVWVEAKQSDLDAVERWQ